LIRFFVRGVPAPKGSTRAFVVKGHAVVTADNTKTRPWEQAIRAEASIAGCRPLVGPVKVTAVFFLQRPAGHYRPNGFLRSSAPMEHTKKPDTDKLARALLDGLTGVAFHDDAQVVWLTARKEFAGGGVPLGASVEVEAIDAASVEAGPAFRWSEGE
jgi:crossover junction endodeoxyribonuclease RusA